MSAHEAGVFGLGTEPPPDSSEPSRYVMMSPPLPTAPRSAWVIWPTLSARVIRDMRSATRCWTGSDRSRYGRPCALRTTSEFGAVTLAPSAVTLTGMALAIDGGV